MWILLRIWDLSLSFGQRSPVKGVFTKMEVRKFVQRLHGSYQNKVDKRPRYFSLFMANQKKKIITKKLTGRVSVFFFPHWQYLVRFIYLLCRLVLRFAVVAGNSIHSSFFLFFLFFFYVYVFPSFSFFFHF